jgi:hypothetical protein
MQNKWLISLAVALSVAMSACGKKQEAPVPPSTPAPSTSSTPAGVTLSAISLGKALGMGKKIAQATDSFGTNDTIYASVDTAGTGTATLNAKWTYRKNGQVAVVKEDSQTIVSTGAATSEFHVSKPDGWPTGDYQVEIFVAEKSAGSKTFTVK